MKRGLILGPERVLARNRVERRGGKTLYFRRYPQGKLAAHVVGYSTVARARAGLEKSLNGTLTGTEGNLGDLVERQLDDLRRKPIVGDTVVTTLDVKAQQVALETLGRRCGAVAALDPRSGKLLVMASSPSYNPNLVENRFGEIAKITADCRPAAPLVNRASQGLYPPGLDLQGRDRRGGARLEPLRAWVELRRSGVLHRVRQARQQLRHEPAVRERRSRDGAPVLRQLGVLQHRQGARREADPRPGAEVRLLRAAAARDTRERAISERALSAGRPLVPRAELGRRRRPDGVRAGADARDTAADGDGRGRDRQRGDRHAPVRRREARLAEGPDGRADEAGAARPRRRAGRRARHLEHDGARGRGGHGHRGADVRLPRRAERRAPRRRVSPRGTRPGSSRSRDGPAGGPRSRSPSSSRARAPRAARPPRRSRAS